MSVNGFLGSSEMTAMHVYRIGLLLHSRSLSDSGVINVFVNAQLRLLHPSHHRLQTRTESESKSESSDLSHHPLDIPQPGWGFTVNSRYVLERNFGFGCSILRFF